MVYIDDNLHRSPQSSSAFLAIFTDANLVVSILKHHRSHQREGSYREEVMKEVLEKSNVDPSHIIFILCYGWWWHN
jgi:hypothetical protein